MKRIFVGVIAGVLFAIFLIGTSYYAHIAAGGDPMVAMRLIRSVDWRLINGMVAVPCGILGGVLGLTYPRHSKEPRG